MNKTLLLILVDFLLLTILSMTKWDEEVAQSEAPDDPDVNAENVAAMALMEQDFLDTLKSSLEEERIAQERLQSEAMERSEALATAQQRIDEKDTKIAGLEGTLEAAGKREESLEKQRQNLETEVAKAKSEIGEMETQITKSQQSIADLQEQYSDSQTAVAELQQKNQLATLSLDTAEKQNQSLSIELKQREARARMLQEELTQRLAEIEAKEAALAKEQETNRQSQARIQELNIQVKVAEEKGRMLEQNVATLRTEVESERAEKQELQKHATELAQGMTTLAERSEDIKEEIRSNVAITANQLFDRFQKNGLGASFVSERFTRGKVIEEREDTMTILVSDGKDTVALTHLDGTPLGLGKNPLGYRRVSSSLMRGDAVFAPSSLEFLSVDPRIAAVALTDEDVSKLGVEVYYVALEPFKFSEAVLVDSQGRHYGELEFKLYARTPGYVRMQSKILSRVFGEISPSKGDLVFSKTGELLGIMIDRTYCAIISTLAREESIPLDTRFENNEMAIAIRSLRSRFEGLPSEAK